MSKGIIYIDYDEALNIYGKMIDASDGGFEGVRDEGGIRATLDFVQNDLYYPTFANKLTYLIIDSVLDTSSMMGISVLR